jgi:uroporphyrinogen decarboxylase
MISGKENYRRAVEFEGPAYLPCLVGAGWVDLDWLWEKDPRKIERIETLRAQFPDDLLSMGSSLNRTEPVEKEGALHWVDEWGTGWADYGQGAKPETYPMAGGYEALADYAFPDPALPERLASMDRLPQERGERYARGSVWFTLFERLWMLRGFENALIDPYLEPQHFSRLRDRILAFNLDVIDAWLARGVDGIFFSDDWGSQENLLIRPADWRKYYKPAYKAMFERVRAGGAHVWMHLCGNVMAILPDLVEIGLNVLNPVQPQAMDVHELAREYGGILCFNGGVDVQGTLINGTPEDVKHEVYTLVELLGRYNGGYIGGVSHTVMPETPLDNVIAMYEAFVEIRE